MDPKKRSLNDSTPNKKRHVYFDDNNDDDDEFNKYYNQNNDDNNNDNDSDNNDKEDEKELVIIDKEINNLNDLIELGKIYDPTKKYSINLKILNKLVDSLTELNNLIGMETVKQDMVDLIIYKIQNFDDNNDMLHTVIFGPPGVGKTEVAKIIGKIYLNLGILKNNKFIKAKRSDLVAGYLGQTAKLTQKVIDSANGGILFIDEVYSLGNNEKRDSFSKECIDTLNENLTEKKNDFICIIAGYKDEINTCFFSYNPGLERRFPVRFTIEPYKGNELFLIFKKKITDINWTIDDSIKSSFFDKNIKYFQNFGGDMEILFSRCKRSHSRRVFTSSESNKKHITLIDLQKGFESFIQHKQIKDKNNSWKNMYI